MKMKPVILFILISLFLAGCIPSQEIESLGIINARGVDKMDNNQLETTLNMFQFEAQSDNITKVIYGRGPTIKGALENANEETNFMLAPGKIQLELYGKKTAESGIFPYLDTLNRDPMLPDTMYLAISKSTAKEILTINEKDISMNIGQFLHGVIEENSNDHLFPRVTMQDFLSKFYDVGKDPVVPMFELINDIPKLTSIGLMRDDKLVGEVSAKNLVLYNLIWKKVKEKRLEISIPLGSLKEHIEKESNIHIHREVLYTSSKILKGKSKTTLIDKGNLKFQTKINLDLDLNELSEKIILKKEHVLKLLEKEFEKELESRYQKMMKKMQQINSDAFGYGSIYRVHKKNGKLKRTEWRETFPKIKVDFKVNVNIIRHGSID